MYPILFEIGVITVFSLWFFIALGCIVGGVLFAQLAKWYRVRFSIITTHSVVLLLWTFACSRLIFILFHPGLYFYRFNLFSPFAVWDKGFSFWGGLFAWVAGIWYLSKKYKQSTAELWDIMVPAILIGIAFGNFGAFLDGSNYGEPTSLPWGITFRNANVKYISPIHPTQLYAVGYSLLIALSVVALLKTFRGKLPAASAELGIAAFSLAKFIEEFFRGDDTVTVFSLRLPQIGALIAFVIASYFIYLRYTNKTGRDPERLLQKTLLSLRGFTLRINNRNNPQ